MGVGSVHARFSPGAADSPKVVAPCLQLRLLLTPITVGTVGMKIQLLFAPYHTYHSQGVQVLWIAGFSLDGHWNRSLDRKQNRSCWSAGALLPVAVPHSRGEQHLTGCPRSTTKRAESITKPKENEGPAKMAQLCDLTCGKFRRCRHIVELVCLFGYLVDLGSGSHTPLT